MNSRQRVFTALEGKKEPDRIPHFEWSIVNKVITRANIWPKFAWSYADLIELYDIDGVVAWPLYETRQYLDNLIIDESGIIRKEGTEDYAVSLDKYSPIKTEDDLENYKFPDPDNPLRWIILKGLVSRFKGERAIIIKIRDIFSWPRELFGYEQFMINIATNKNLISKAINKSVNYAKELAKRAVNLGAEIIFNADDIANAHGLVIAPKDYKDLFLPKYKELVDFFKTLGVFIIKHTDGDITSVLGDLIDCGIDCIDPIENVGKMSLEKIKKEYGMKVSLKGNVDCSKILTMEDENKIINATKNCIKIAGPGGRYILSSNNSIHSGVPIKNYCLMLDTLKKFGRYPLDLSK